VSPDDLLIPQESSRLPLQSTGCKKQHLALTEANYMNLAPGKVNIYENNWSLDGLT
jgi:hypothetical protein